MDAVAIIDCHKLGYWQAISKFYSAETVEECFKECLRGKNKAEATPIVETDLLAQLGAAPHIVTVDMEIALLEKIPGVLMDKGERDLIAFALTQPKDTYFLCGPDNALVRASVYTDISERVISLEEAVSKATGSRSSKIDKNSKNTSQWLNQMRTKVLLEFLP